MGLSGAMNSGISGLQAFSSAMGVIGNNLANANTAGFKASRTLFSDMIPDYVSGTGGTSQIGRGAGLSTVDSIFTQGSIERTSSNLDLAIEGSGFFMVRNSDSPAVNYTRAGTFRLNENGNIVNPEGYVLQGYPGRSEGGFEDLTGDIQINTRSLVPGQASSEVGLTTNLNAQSGILTWDLDFTTSSSNFGTTAEVYDSLGNTHLISTYFNKTGNNTWEYHQTVPAAEINNSTGNPTNTDNTLVEISSGVFTFDTQGLLSQITPAGGIAITPSDPAWPNVTIPAGNLDWNNGADATLPLDYAMQISQFATDSKVVTQLTDGYSSGYLSDVAVDTAGTIIGTYSNGEVRELAKLALGKFSNTSGLEKLGKNLYGATNSSGPADVGTPGSGIGKIYSNSLEQSTVDIAEEFTRMITTQRSFQANSKTITTTDEMLSEVINMKR